AGSTDLGPERMCYDGNATREGFRTIREILHRGDPSLGIRARMDSLTFLERVDRLKPQPVYALHGDEEFLKRQVLSALRTILLGKGDHAFGLSTYSGDKATLAAVRDELETLPFLTPRRLVIVENADSFVSQFRTQLEKYVAEPATAGVLVLDVK